MSDSIYREEDWQTPYNGLISRNVLVKTPLTRVLGAIELPENSKHPALRIQPEMNTLRIYYKFVGREHLIEWQDQNWVKYEKEGVQWYDNKLTDLDYSILYELLESQLHDQLT